MSTHIVGFRPPDETWDQMKAVWLACEAAGIQKPTEVLKFFNYESPGDKPGNEIAIKVHKWMDNYREGFEIHIAELPDEVSIIRFYNSY